MGSKNRILLGAFSAIILHHVRNVFEKKELYITKRKAKILISNRKELKTYLTKDKDFQNIINNTIATCDYKDKNIINFISKIDERYLIYAVSFRGYYNEIATIYFTSKRQIRKCLKSIKFFTKAYEDELLEKL